MGVDAYSRHAAACSRMRLVVQRVALDFRQADIK